MLTEYGLLVAGYLFRVHCFYFLVRNKYWMLNNNHICFGLFAKNVFVAFQGGGTVGSENIHHLGQ